MSLAPGTRIGPYIAGVDRGRRGAALARRRPRTLLLAPDATLMAVPVTAAGATFESGTPVGLFPTRVVNGGTAT